MCIVLYYANNGLLWWVAFVTNPNIVVVGKYGCEQ